MQKMLRLDQNIFYKYTEELPTQLMLFRFFIFWLIAIFQIHLKVKISKGSSDVLFVEHQRLLCYGL